MNRGRRRTPANPTRRRVALALGVLGAAILLVVVLLPLMGRWSSGHNPAESGAPGPRSTVTLYHDSRLGPIPGPYFEGVAENGYDVEAFGTSDGFVTYESDHLTAKIGIDVSVFQGEIDWSQVRDSGVEYAMIRVGRRGYTQGAIAKDEAFDQNMRGALDAGLPVGVYFFSQAVSVAEAEEEARQVLEWIDGYEITYPVVFDWEIIPEDNARTNHVSAQELSDLHAAFCRVIADAGYTPAVYAGSQMVLRGLDLSAIAEYDLWLVEYKSVPTFYYDFSMWQYTASGQVPGIQGSVDLNLCFKPYD